MHSAGFGSAGKCTAEAASDDDDDDANSNSYLAGDETKRCMRERGMTIRRAPRAGQPDLKKRLN